MKKANKIILCFGILALVAFGCTKSFEDTNVSPNSPVDMPTYALMTNVQKQLMDNMAVVELSRIITVMGDWAITASKSPVIPEWQNVESPITATEGNNPASTAPLAMTINHRA